MSRHIPRFLGSYKMYQANCTLEMLVGRDILIIRARRAVVRETESMPVSKVHVQQALVGAVKAGTAFRKSFERKVVLHIWPQYHNTAVKAIGPADIGGSGEIYVHVQELVGGFDGHHVRVNVYDALELCLSPQLDLCEGCYQVRTLHEPEVRRRMVRHPIDGYELIVNSLDTSS